MPDKRFLLNEHTLPPVEEIGRHMPGGFLIYQAEQPEKMLYANQKVFEIFGCEGLEDFQRLTGWTFRGIVRPEDYAAVTDGIYSQISHDNMDHVEYRIIRKDGAVRWVDDYGHYSETEAFGGVFYVFISDITEKREQMEKDAATRTAVINTLMNIYHAVWLINNVETETCSLYHGDMSMGSVHAEALRNALSNIKYTDTKTQYVNTMAAEEANKAKTAFLSNMSHEIRTPLNAIIAMTANAFDEDVQQSLPHLSKPVEPEHLYQTLEELIREADQAAEN